MKKVLTFLPRGLAHRFRRDRRAVGAVEFAFTFPLVLMMLYGTTEYVRFTLWARHISQLADTLAEATSTKTTSMNDGEVHFLWDSALAMIPDAQAYSQLQNSAWWNMIRVGISSATIKKAVPSCKSNCAVQATIDWSAGEARMTRPCGKLTPVADNTTSEPQTIPKSLLALSSVIIADVEADYQPMIGSDWIPKITLRRSAFYMPRTQPSISYVPHDAGYNCP